MEQPNSISKNNDNNISAIKIVNEDDAFGDFRDIITVNTKDAAKRSTTNFGDFNGSTESAKGHVTLHNAKMALSAGPANKSSRKINQNDPVTSMDNADDFGDFVCFEGPNSTNKV